MENNRPKLSDTKEYSLIKSIYFEKDLPKENIDLDELYERRAAKIKNTQNQTR